MSSARAMGHSPDRAETVQQGSVHEWPGPAKQDAPSIVRLPPITIPIRNPGPSIDLHALSAAGLTTPEQEAELDAWCAAFEQQSTEEEAGSAQEAPATYHG